MKKVLLILAFLLTVTVINAEVIYYQATEINVCSSKQWGGWRDIELTIGFDNVDNIMVLFSEEQQAYKLTYSKKAIEENVVSYIYKAKDQDGYSVCIIFSYSSDNKYYITIGYPDFAIMYHVYQKRK